LHPDDPGADLDRPSRPLRRPGPEWRPLPAGPPARRAAADQLPLRVLSRLQPAAHAAGAGLQPAAAGRRRAPHRADLLPLAHRQSFQARAGAGARLLDRSQPGRRGGLSLEGRALHPRRALDALQDHHRDDALGQLLLALEIGDGGRQLGPLLRRCRPGPDLQPLPTHLHDGQRVGHQVVVPGGVRASAVVGRDHHVAVAVPPEAQDGGPRLPGPGACGRQQQDGAPRHLTAEPAAGGPEIGNDRLVESLHVTGYGWRRARPRPRFLRSLAHVTLSFAGVKPAGVGRLKTSVSWVERATTIRTGSRGLAFISRWTTWGGTQTTSPAPASWMTSSRSPAKKRAAPETT